MNSYLSGEETLNEGVKSLQTGAGRLSEPLSALVSGADKVKKGSDALADETKTKKLTDGSAAVAEGISDLHASIVDIQGMLPSSSEGGSTGSEGEAATASYADVADAVSGLSEQVSSTIATLQSSIDMEETVIADLNSVLATAQSYYSSYSGAASVMKKLGSDTVSQALSDYQSVVDKLNSDITALTEKRNEQIAERDALQSVYASAQNCVVLAENTEEGGTTEISQEDLLKKLTEAINAWAELTDNKEETQLGAGSAAVAGDISTYIEGAKELNADVNGLTDGITKLSSGAATLVNGVSQLSAGATALTNNNNDLKNAGTSLTTNGTALTNGAATLKGSSQDLKDGAKTLSDGTGSLKTGAAPGRSRYPFQGLKPAGNRWKDLKERHQYPGKGRKDPGYWRSFPEGRNSHLKERSRQLKERNRYVKERNRQLKERCQQLKERN